MDFLDIAFMNIMIFMTLFITANLVEELLLRFWYMNEKLT